jgi:FKBP-type peptidyl-prolyl cis-trans isomerase 2
MSNTNLKHDLIMLCKHNQDGSFATQANRRGILFLVGRQLNAGGYRHMQASSLQTKHVDYLVNRWKSEKLSTGTIKNRVAALRWWSEKIGKAGVLPADNAALGIPQRQYVGQGNKAKMLDADKLNAVSDPYVRLSLQMQAAFGLRREESIKIMPQIADHGNVLYLKGSWCKGNRERVIPIRTGEQRAVLDAVHRLAGAGALIPADKNYVQQQRAYDGQTQAAGLHKNHGLRHLYAQSRYEELTGWKCPIAGGPERDTLTGAARKSDKAARLTISKELGHGRIGIVSNYCG